MDEFQVCVDILSDVVAKTETGEDLLMVRIENKFGVHYEYGFVDECEAMNWVNEQNLFAIVP